MTITLGKWSRMLGWARQLLIVKTSVAPGCGIAAEPVDEPGWIGSSRPSAKLNSLVKC